MVCSNCGTNCGGTCNACSKNPCKSCCKNPCLRWGFDDCFLRGRCPDGTELDPLNLCAWLKSHETCTEFRLVPRADGDSYMEFINECDESQKLYVCDFLGLSKLECLGNVNNETPSSCDLLVFDPCCGSDCGTGAGKWSHYHIPDAGDCELQPDENGYYHVLTKNDCGCIIECKLFAQTRVWEWALRDSWPDDPDWPFSMGSRTGDNSEIIDLQLDTKVPMFGKTDLEVTVQYAYGIQNTSPSGIATLNGNYNFKSIVTPMYTATHNPNVTDIVSKAIVIQASNLLPWGSWEGQASRTFLVPKGKKLYLNHVIEQRDGQGNMEAWHGESTAPTLDSSRLHALHVFARAVKGVSL